MLMGFILHFYIIFGTNLLTGGPAHIVVLLPVSVFRRKGISNGVKTERNQLEKLFLEGNPPDGLGLHVRRYGRCSRGWGACPPPGRAPASWGPRSSTDVLLPPIYSYVPRKHPGAPRKTISTAATLCIREIPSWSLRRCSAGGGSHHRWPSSSSRRPP